MKFIAYLFLIILFSNCSRTPDELNEDEKLFFESIEVIDGSINGWDLFDAADMQLSLTGDTQNYFFEIKENVESFKSVKWDLNPFDLQASDFRWTLSIRDIDNIGFDEMVEFTFNPFLRWRQLRDEQATKLDFYHEQWHIVMNVKMN